jgi:hypothetical protein
MKTFLTMEVVLLLVCSALFPQSQIVSTTFYSASLNREIPVKIYLPVGYSADAAPYRLYVYLHGSIYGGVDLSSVDYATMYKPAIDSAIESGQIDPMVIVFPQVLFEEAQGVYIPFNKHLWTNSERNGKYESVVSVDLLQWIGTQYNVSTRREARAIGGIHSGAIGAINMAIRNSEKFVACASNVSWPSVMCYMNFLAQGGTDNPPYHFTLNTAGEVFWISIASAFSPNLINPNMPELMLDFPMDEQGNFIRSVFYDQWYAKHDPATLMRNLNIYRQDVAFYNQVPVPDKWIADMFDAELSSIGVPNSWYLSPVDSPPNIPSKDEVIMTLSFIDQAMDEAASSTTEVYEHDIRLAERRDQITHFNAYVNDIGAPQVWVQNTGTAIETNIAVECVLSQNDQQQMTVTVDSLKSLEAKLLTFNLKPQKNEDFELAFTAKLPNDQNAANDQLTLSMTASELVDDFEKGNQLWQTNQDWGVTPQSYSSGKFCMEDRPYLNYKNNKDTWAVFNGSFNLSTLTDAQLSLQTKYVLLTEGDKGTVEISTDSGGTWKALGEPLNGKNNKWHEISLPLKAYCGQGFTNVSIRFRLVTDAEKTSTGWFVDDIYIKAGGTNAAEKIDQTVDVFQLFNNYPNPFNAGTTITYTLPTADRVTLTLYNSLGQQVVTIVDRKEQSGKHRAFWDGRDQSGLPAASGVYVYSLKAGELVQQKKLVVLK